MQSKIMLPLTFFIIIMLVVRLITEEAEEFSLPADQGLRKVEQVELSYHLKQDTLLAKDSADSDSASSDSARAALNMRQ